MIDNTSPGAGPGDPGRYLRGLVTLTAAPEDASGIASVEFQFSPSGAGAWATIEHAHRRRPVRDDVEHGRRRRRAVRPPGRRHRRGRKRHHRGAPGPAQGRRQHLADRRGHEPGRGRTPLRHVHDHRDRRRPAARRRRRRGRVPGAARRRRLGHRRHRHRSAVRGELELGRLAGRRRRAARRRLRHAGNEPFTSAVRTITRRQRRAVRHPLRARRRRAARSRSPRPGRATSTTWSSSDARAPARGRRSAATRPRRRIRPRARHDRARRRLARAARPRDRRHRQRGHERARSRSRSTTPPRRPRMTQPTAGAIVGGPRSRSAANVADATSGVALGHVPDAPRRRSGVDGRGRAPRARRGRRAGTRRPLTDGQAELRVTRHRRGRKHRPERTDQRHRRLDRADGHARHDPGDDPRQRAAERRGLGRRATGVAFERRAAGGSWAAIGSDSSAPYALTFNTASIADGVYDLRAVVRDAAGNTADSVRTGVRIDNAAPTLVSSSPSDGATVAAVETVRLTANEPLGGADVTVDGAAVAVAIDGATATISRTLGAGRARGRRRAARRRRPRRLLPRSSFTVARPTRAATAAGTARRPSSATSRPTPAAR